MEAFLTSLISGVTGIVAYCVVFGVLIACGMGVPLPEDVSLVTGGFLAHVGAVNLQVMMAVGFVGILSGDTIIFFAGRRLSTGAGRGSKFFNRVITSEKRRRVEGLFSRHGEKIVMIARFLPGVRAVTYFTAGSARMRYFRFICWDGLAALVSAPLFVFLGYQFGDKLEELIQRIRHGQLRVVVGLLVVLVGYVLISRFLARRRVALERQRESTESGKLDLAPPENSSSARIVETTTSLVSDTD